MKNGTSAEFLMIYNINWVKMNGGGKMIVCLKKDRRCQYAPCCIECNMYKSCILPCNIPKFFKGDQKKILKSCKMSSDQVELCFLLKKAE